MIQPSVCGEWKRKKIEKYGHVNKLLKSISVYKRRKEKKIINTTKFEVDIVLERKRKKLKRVKVRQIHGFSRK